MRVPESLKHILQFASRKNGGSKLVPNSCPEVTGSCAISCVNSIVINYQIVTVNKNTPKELLFLNLDTSFRLAVIKFWHVFWAHLSRVLGIFDTCSWHTFDPCYCHIWHVFLPHLTHVTATFDTCSCHIWHMLLPHLTHVLVTNDTCSCPIWHIFLPHLTRVLDTNDTCSCPIWHMFLPHLTRVLATFDTRSCHIWHMFLSHLTCVLATFGTCSCHIWHVLLSRFRRREKTMFTILHLANGQAGGCP